MQNIYNLLSGFNDGFQCWTDARENVMKNVENDFISALKAVIACAQMEINNIENGKDSGWTLGQLEETVMPEIDELLSFALNGTVFYKYGKKQRLLESSYISTDSLEDLNNTALGKQILELQRLYNKL